MFSYCQTHLFEVAGPFFQNVYYVASIKKNHTVVILGSFFYYHYPVWSAHTPILGKQLLPYTSPPKARNL